MARDRSPAWKARFCCQRGPAILLALILFVLTGCASPKHFVARSGRTLTLNGRMWRFVGFNDIAVTSARDATVCAPALDQKTLASFMRDVRGSGGSVIRAWFYQSFYDMSNSGGSWHEIRPTWAPFDRVLHAAASYGLKVIPALVNEWQACEPGGMPKDLDFYRRGYKYPGYGYPLSFKRYATTVARHYADDPRIAFWQLGNELESYSAGTCNEKVSARALRTFADDTTSSMKAADANHLVSLGTIGYNQCGLVGADYEYVHAGRIDLCDYHDYGVVTRSLPVGANSLAQRIAQCRTLNKPMFIGESGIAADIDDAGRSTGKITPTSLQLRAGFFNAKMTAAFNNGVVGYVIWNKLPVASNSAGSYASGRFNVGPSNLFFDPTNNVTTSIARTFGVTPGTVRFGFEAGRIDGWSVAERSPSLSLSNTTLEAWGGLHSLLLTPRFGGRTFAAQTSATAGAGARTTITYHVYLPSVAPSGIRAVPYASDDLLRQTVAPPIVLHPGWNVVQWTLPRGIGAPLHALGIGIDNRAGWHGPVAIDDVAW